MEHNDFVFVVLVLCSLVLVGLNYSVRGDADTKINKLNQDVAVCQAKIGWQNERAQSLENVSNALAYSVDELKAKNANLTLANTNCVNFANECYSAYVKLNETCRS